MIGIDLEGTLIVNATSSQAHRDRFAINVVVFLLLFKSTFRKIPHQINKSKNKITDTHSL